jgi:hypothetical protein
MRRRWIAWRTLEYAGVGAACAAGPGLLMVLVLVWRGDPVAFSFASSLLSVGAAAGAMLSLSRRPTLLQTAIEADTQLQLADLLSAAVTTGPCRDHAFGRVVVAQAERRCRELHPGNLIVRRLGRRAWGGIGIVSALVLTLATMATHPVPSVARDGALAQDGDGIRSENNDRLSRSSFAASKPTRIMRADAPRAQRPDLPSDHPDRGGDYEDAGNDARSAERGPTNPAAPRDRGSGAASGRTDDLRAAAVLRQAGPVPDAVAGTDVASGGGRRDDRSVGAAADDHAATSSTDANVSARIPPWRSASWRADRDAALRAVESGRVPDAYRDLVREYFDRETP